MRATAWLWVLAVACSPDGDGDGWLEPEDCDDSVQATYPDAPEFCDGVDNDCDGQVDEPTAEDTTVYYIDRDGDGVGTDRYDRDGDGTPEASGVQKTCEQPFGYSAVSGDCDDDDADVFPGQGC